MPGQASQLGATLGAIGAALVTAARCSAGLTRRALAHRIGTDAATVRDWETGTLPLYAVGYHQLQRLAEALRHAGACTGTTVAALVLAGQCDLFIAGMAGGFEDYAEVPPLEHDVPDGQLTSALLRWALTGTVPEQCRTWARPGPLLSRDAIATFTAAADDLAHGSEGPELADYGTALLALMTP